MRISIGVEESECYKIERRMEKERAEVTKRRKEGEEIRTEK